MQTCVGLFTVGASGATCMAVYKSQNGDHGERCGGIRYFSYATVHARMLVRLRGIDGFPKELHNLYRRICRTLNFIKT